MTRSLCDTIVIKINSFLLYHCRRELQAEFVNERNWDQYHSPRNILLAMVGEVGEVAEHL